MTYAQPLSNLIDCLKKLPNIGPKSAQRLAMHIFNMPEDDVRNLILAMEQVKSDLVYCDTCHNIATERICDICADEFRDTSIVCVVPENKDIYAIERTGYKGVYHILGGLISPIDGISIDKLNIARLFRRIESEGVKELIFAIPPTNQGDITAFYIRDRVKKINEAITISRIVYGLPIGSDIDYADDKTLINALQSRRAL